MEDGGTFKRFPVALRVALDERDGSLARSRCSSALPTPTTHLSLHSTMTPDNVNVCKAYCKYQSIGLLQFKMMPIITTISYQKNEDPAQNNEDDTLEEPMQLLPSSS